MTKSVKMIQNCQNDTPLPLMSPRGYIGPPIGTFLSQNKHD